ncbi:MAG: hypothetical protein OFPI_31550 [Osedax symbiont Rs2]|nr:MAG: hypothetical protein OFPI_31550 [Osedax symbiont Rs2]
MKKLLLADVNSDMRLSERIHQLLLARILAAQMKPGEIVAEQKLAQELGVSRTPVHDALRDLIKDGFLHQEKNRRPVVNKFSVEDVYDIFEIRILLEGEAFLRAAQRMDRETLAKLRASAEQLQERIKDSSWLEHWAEFDDVFHRSIARASGSKRLLQDIIRHRLSHRALNVQADSPNFFSNSLDEHFAILDALDQRDGQRAKSAMQTHIRESQTLFVSKFT